MSADLLEWSPWPGFPGVIFNLQRLRDMCESVIYGALYEFMSAGDCEFKRFDYYDNSLEFWCRPGVELSELDQAVLWTLGFDRCWVCYRESVDGEWVGNQVGEKYYCSPAVILAWKSRYEAKQ